MTPGLFGGALLLCAPSGVLGVAYSERAWGWLRWIQRGSVHAYLFYILLTLIILMLWA